MWKNWGLGYAEVKKLDGDKNSLAWLAPAPANNTWVIAVRKDLAESQGLKTMDDFARYLARGGRIKLAASAEFVESPSALPAFEATYGFRLTDEQLLTLSGGNTAATLRAAAEGMSDVNAAMAYGTDGALAALGLTALDDDRGAQTVYAPAPVVRDAVLRRTSGNRDHPRPGLRHTDARDVAAAQRRDRRRRSGRRFRRRCLSEIEALPAVNAIRNQVLLTLVAGGCVAVAAAGFVALAPNRLVSGRPIALWAAGDAPWALYIAALGIILLASCFTPPSRTVNQAAALLGGALLLLTLTALGHAAQDLASRAPPASRVSPGAAFWILAGCAALAVVDALQRLRAGPLARLVAVAVIVAGVLALAAAGTFDALSIAQEYASRRQVFADALVRHVVLVVGSVGPAILIGFPLGVAGARFPALQGPLFAVLEHIADDPVDRALRLADCAAFCVGVRRAAARGARRRRHRRGAGDRRPGALRAAPGRAQYDGGACRASSAPSSTPRAGMGLTAATDLSPGRIAARFAGACSPGCASSWFRRSDWRWSRR